jgi:hypothetical protein
VSETKQEATPEIADLHLLRHHGAVLPHGEDLVPRLIGHYRRVGQQERFSRSAERQINAGESAGRQKQVSVRDGRAGMNRAARPVECVIDKVERTVPAKLRFVAECDFDLIA